MWVFNTTIVFLFPVQSQWVDISGPICLIEHGAKLLGLYISQPDLPITRYIFSKRIPSFMSANELNCPPPNIVFCYLLQVSNLEAGSIHDMRLKPKMFSRIPWFIPRFKFETFLQCEEVACFPLFRKVCMPMRKFQHKVLLQKLHNEPRARIMFELNVLDFLAINVTVIAGVSLPFHEI